MRKLSLSLILLAAFCTNAIGQNFCKQVLFTDDFSAAAPWQVQATGNISVSNGGCHIDNVYSGTYNRIYQPIGVTLADGYYWRAECDFYSPGGNATAKGVGVLAMALTADTLDFMSYDGTQNYLETTQDGVCIAFLSPTPTNSNFGDWFFLMEAKKGNQRTYDLGTKVLTVPGVNQYYLRLERISIGMLEMSVFIDSARTNHAPGSPVVLAIDPAITGLKVIQHGTTTPGFQARLNNAVIDNDYICGMAAVGIAEGDARRILVYPNPATDAIRIEASGLEGIGTYSIVNLLGVEVMGGEWEAGRAIDVAGLAEGVYLMQWSNGDGVYWGRFRKVAP